mmetsp:Transcript_90511/g.180656  ORF Transcript_90511/g.180656 Transcript_90511/m.180656 type:complete len:140 (+) Transcript_90511:222-641(+)
MTTASSARSGGGKFNWGNPLDEYYEDDYEEEYADEEPIDPSLLTKMRNASIVQEKALAAKYRREGMPAEEEAAAAAAPSTAWGQSNRVEAMKDRLLALEREKIARMNPERLELMNMLADHGYTLDDNTVTALLAWKGGH